MKRDVSEGTTDREGVVGRTVCGRRKNENRTELISTERKNELGLDGHR